jgi:hypothetical protein
VVCPWVYHDSGCRSRLNDSNLWPIITTPSANPSSDGAFEDWTILSHPAPHSIDVHIFGLRGSPGYTNSLVGFLSCASGISDTSCKPLCRAHRRLQRPSDPSTEYYTRVRLSVCLTMIYSWLYSTTTEWKTSMLGMFNLDGARSLTFVRDGVSSFTPRHPTSVCIFYAHMAPLW